MICVISYLRTSPISHLASSLLGAGGGGDPYVGGLIARQALDKAGSVELYDADEVPDEWLVATIGGVGAPSVLAEKGINGCEITNLLAAQEEQLGRKLDRPFCPRMVA